MGREARMVSYDAENDVLLVHNGFSKNETFKGNLDAGQIILDISSALKVRGIEVWDASKFFEQFGIRKAHLKSIKSARFSAAIRPSGVTAFLILKISNIEEQKIPLAIPTESLYQKKKRNR